MPPGDYPYGAASYLRGSVETAIGPVPRVATRLERADRLGALRVRCGIARGDYRVRPGLYALGTPDPTAPVLVTANYKLSFDAVRRAVDGLDSWLLVVDTEGINVWCAAGKKTFSTDEVVRVVRQSRLEDVVEHRRLILPQLAAPGVAAHEVKRACGFRVTYGPIRAHDLPAFLAANLKADAAMRTVTFDLGERLVLTPVEIGALRDRRLLAAFAAIIAASSIDRDGVSLALGLRRGLPVVGAAGLAVLAGGGLTPALLPWLPGRAFALKGVTVGALAAGATAVVFRRSLSPSARLALLAGVPTAASYVAMTFTGSTPVTSPSGVEAEMRRALPLQAVGAVVAVGAWLAGRLGRRP